MRRPKASAEAVAMDRSLTLELVRVTERAAIAAAMLRGRGDEKLADEAAVAAMHDELSRLKIRGRIVIGEDEGGEAGRLSVGAQVGTGEGPEVDVALDPLEGRTICAKNLPNAVSVVALAGRDALLAMPAIYMEKVAVGPFYEAGLVDLDMPPGEAIRKIARAKGVKPREISACVLDRPRNARVVEAVRATGASVRLIGDGDVAAIIHATDPERTGIDIYLGSGGAQEGVLAAAALRCIGGQMCGRLILDTADRRRRAERAGLQAGRVYRAGDMASGDVLFAATGVTDGDLLDGVRFSGGAATTDSLATRSHTGTQRWVRAKHRLGAKFDAMD
jgi:fructose-1,6-bisphosphatase II / sedoheptulose-1,7-bisphosphatase